MESHFSYSSADITRTIFPFIWCLMFCTKCGQEVEEIAVYCPNCGYKLLKDEAKRAVNENKSSYNKWARVISVIWGTIILIGSIDSGIPCYFESGLLLVIICNILEIIVGIILILLGLFPEYINSKVQIKDKYPEIVVCILIVSFVIITIEPAPPDLSPYFPNMKL